MDEKSNSNINNIGCGNSSEIGPNGGNDGLEDLIKLLDIDSCRSAWSTGLVSIEIEIRSLMIQAREG